MFRKHRAQRIQTFERENKGIMKRSHPFERLPRIFTDGSSARPAKRMKRRQISEDI